MKSKSYKAINAEKINYKTEKSLYVKFKASRKLSTPKLNLLSNI